MKNNNTIKPIIVSSISSTTAPERKVSDSQVYRRVITTISHLSFRVKILLVAWFIFLVLVLFGIQGSSIGLNNSYISQQTPPPDYVLQPVATLLHDLFNVDEDSLSDALLSTPRDIRADEWLVNTPLALSQTTHNPPFPVINDNLGTGQNMLTVSFEMVPVWHIATLARPSTWGYFFLSPAQGLAWQWWFAVYACFTTLFLLLEIVLKNHVKLALFGSLWFCGSAYVTGWSLWPALVAFFPLLGCLAAYHLLAAPKIWQQYLCGVLLGLSIPGFLMFLYPAWQIPVAYLAVLLFIGLAIRDKLYFKFRQDLLHRLLALALAAAITLIIGIAFLLSTWSDLQKIARTVYPGNRLSTGGDVAFGDIFKGMYNIITLYGDSSANPNPSEQASYYLLFPVVLLALAFSHTLRKNFGVIGWIMVGYLLFLLYYMLIGIPAILAKVTLFDRVTGVRTDFVLGLVSIILCVYTLARLQDLNVTWSRLTRNIIVAGMTGLIFVHGLTYIATTDVPLNVAAVCLASGLAGLIAYYFITANKLAFTVIVGLLVAGTSIWFNPLSSGISHIYDSELAQQVKKIDQASGGTAVWLFYGNYDPIITALGINSLSGVYDYPQAAIWNEIDPKNQNAWYYNRYIRLIFDYEPDVNKISYWNPTQSTLHLSISPENPALKKLGVRYVIMQGDEQAEAGKNLKLVYQSAANNFSIFEIP